MNAGITSGRKGFWHSSDEMKWALCRKEWNDLKKRYTTLFLAFALLLTLLCACGQQSEQPASSGAEPTRSPVTQGIGKPRPEKTKEISITELYSEEGSGISDGFQYNYSFHVPQIEDDTAGAAAINQEIASTYGEAAKECLESIHNKEIPYCSNMEYENFRSGDILSLVLKYAYFYDGFEEYTVYSYDAAEGVRLTNEDMLKRQNMTEADYLTALRRAAAKDFDDAYHADWENIEDIYSGGYQELRSWTLSEQNLNLDLPLYLSDGVLHVIAPIGSVAGAGYVSRDLALDLEENASDVETAQLGDYLTVKRQGNAVTLRIRQTPQLEALLGEYGLIHTDAALYDKDLTVGGLYGSYTKIFCCEIGEAGKPFVFLLTQEGRVEYIDVLSCLSCGYFCGGGPVLGVTNVKAFDLDDEPQFVPGIDAYYIDAYAVTAGGERLPLFDTVSFQSYTIPQNLQNSGWWNDETGGSLTVSEGNGDNFNYCVFRETGSVSVEIHGILNYLGMTEKGMVYAYRLWGPFSNGPGLTGAAAFDQRSQFSGNDYESTLTVTELGGTPLIGEQTGDTTVLMSSFG